MNIANRRSFEGSILKAAFGQHMPVTIGASRLCGDFWKEMQYGGSY